VPDASVVAAATMALEADDDLIAVFSVVGATEGLDAGLDVAGLTTGVDTAFLVELLAGAAFD